jgi:hypothetical protein
MRRGFPGYIRIDTVHQGAQEGMKGIDHTRKRGDIGTQCEMVASVVRVSEAYRLPESGLTIFSRIQGIGRTGPAEHSVSAQEAA